MEFQIACVYRMQKILFDLSKGVECALKEKNNTVLKDDLEEFSPSAKGFIENLKLFNEIVNFRMKMTAREKFERDNWMKNLGANVEIAQNEIAGLNLSINEERSRHGRVVGIFNAEISEENLLLEEIKKKHSEDLAERIRESEEETRRKWEETLEMSQDLRVQIDKAKKNLDETSRANLIRERELYLKRSTIEKQFLQVVAKYDEEIGELYQTMENLKEELNLLEITLKNLRERMAVQNVRYLEVKKERELAIMKAFAEKLDDFRKKRAAVIVQKAWRSYCERSLAKKKKKSKKKK